jgi:hypothetical protein
VFQFISVSNRPSFASVSHVEGENPAICALPSNPEQRINPLTSKMVHHQKPKRQLLATNWERASAFSLGKIRRDCHCGKDTIFYQMHKVRK